MQSGQWIDPDIVPMLESMPPLLDELADELLGPLREKELADLALLELSGDVERVNHLVPAQGGDLILRVHRPLGIDRDAPCLYSIHGGGYVLGRSEMEDARLEQLCLELGCVATSIEYRLAPETRYPGPLEDCYAGLRWVHEHSTTLGVDPDRVGIGGRSAGGGLAAATALLARERQGPRIAFQLLVYPMLDDRATTRSSAWQVPVWNPAKNRYGWQSYLGQLHDTDDVPPTAAPARATDLTGLPPAFVCVGSADLFMDEDIAYAQALTHAGVPTELHLYPGGIHGFESIAPDAAISVQLRRDVLAWLRRAMAPRN
ncbi:MAG TPA: alpha/beta hydrolase [Acidimicrobiales bacterium]|nr:alpha/beta hydrolase [Acidimicrobiales bacterium]